jgi:phage-related protein
VVATLGTLVAVTKLHALVMAIQAGALKAYLVQTKLVQFATKAWAAMQWLLNAALDANPIGIVVIAIAALVAGIIVAYKHSETFRHIVQTAFHAVGTAAMAMWNDAIRPAFKFIADLWFSVVGALVDGAAKAFGWMPGIGGKLKAAAKQFDHFRDEVNNALSGIHDRNVKVNAELLTRAAYVSGGGATSSVAGGHHFATGGLVTGGVPGQDSVRAMLTPGEFVVTPDGKNLQVSGGGGTSITVNVAGSVTTERDLIQSIIKGFRDYQRRNGVPAVI